MTKEMIKKNFENHVATINQYVNFDKEIKGIDIEVLTWKKPDSSSYMIKYIVTDNTLCVYGDLGEAIYRWSSPITFEWLANLDLSYFKGKCQASEVGRDFKEWNQNKALNALKNFAKDEYFEWLQFEATDGQSSLYSNADWKEWLSHRGHDVLGVEYWEWAYDIGFTTNTRCIYHFLGLMMAMKQIRGDKKEFVIAI